MYAHFPQSVLKGSNAERVVKIFSVDGVDRKRERRAQVAAAGDFERIQYQRNPRGLGLHLGGEVPREPKLLHDRVDFGLVLAAFAKNFDHFAHRSAFGVGPFHEFEHHHLASLSIA